MILPLQTWNNLPRPPSIFKCRSTTTKLQLSRISLHLIIRVNSCLHPHRHQSPLPRAPHSVFRITSNFQPPAAPPLRDRDGITICHSYPTVLASVGFDDSSNS